MMNRYKQFNQLEIIEFETEVWEHPLHNHTYFEFIFIVKGNGIHRINNTELNYEKGDLYLLGPDDEHEFEINSKTKFIYFKFNHFYLDTKDVDNPTEWNRDVDLILNTVKAVNGTVIQQLNDIPLVEQLMIFMFNEYKKNEVLSKKIIFQLFKALILVVKRNLLLKGNIKNTSIKNSNSAEELLEYIDLNIHNPFHLKQKQIANHFNLSENYIGIYFKERVGLSLKQYIQEYRFNLLKQRIINGQISTKQLTIDFGFTDESHLHRFVKSYSGKSLKQMKEELL